MEITVLTGVFVLDCVTSSHIFVLLTEKLLVTRMASSLVSAHSEGLVTSAEKDIRFRMEQVTFYKRIRKQMGFNGIMCSMNQSQ